MKHFSLVKDILISVAVFPLVVFIYMYAGHTTHEKSQEEGNHIKTESVKKESPKILEQVSTTLGRKLLLNKIPAPDVSSKEDSAELNARKIVQNWHQQVIHDTGIYLIVPVFPPVDSIKPL